MSNENPYGNGQMTGTVSFGNSGQAAPAAGRSASPGSDVVKETTTTGFAADVIAESRNQPVLVDFWAPWCGPCKQLAPALEKVVHEAHGRVKLVKMNIDDHPSIAGQLGIQSIPAVIAFVDGQPVDGFMGALPESKVREFVDKIAGPDNAAEAIAQAMVMAEGAVASGNVEQAAQIYASILAEAPDNAGALGGLAGCLSDMGDLAQARAVLARVPQEHVGDPAVRSAEAKIALAGQVGALGDPVELERRLSADPKDHQARLDLAQILNAKGFRDEAAEQLLTSMKLDRAWNEEAARRQLLHFFEAWGPTDGATLSARRKLSALLFS